MSKERTPLGFDQAEGVPSIDPTEWRPKPIKSKRDPTVRRQTRQAAAQAGFQDREPTPQRGRPKTGRDVSRSVKVSTECSELMDALYDQLNEGQRVKIPMGEVVLQAFEALEEKLNSQ